ncbi:hypothetical protein AQ490_03675 [Wenjunlia vitaminophila]|uniref:Alkaline shock response membrane anchor protein AmaP n=1 Tax=Wenjunlia vitaminophila TaxID=76728 RepID=A0A0T6LT20_WENVI|nr:hypothetical protein [Wenjunlia vitaminophila]KRV49303.1 hypothetical protein AQ490_03675 [Wenjunlia vitaminophila]
MSWSARTLVNRVLLALAGLVLLAGGLLVLVSGLDLERHWNFTLPSWWPLDRPDQPVLSEADRTRYRDEGWWWPVVFTALGLLVLLSLWWLLAQLHGRRLGRVLLGHFGDPDREDAGSAWLRGRALEDALEVETRRMDGVDGATVTLHTRRGVPGARMILTLAPHARPASIVERLHHEQIADARASVGLPVLPTDVRLRGDRHPATRVE